MARVAEISARDNPLLVRLRKLVAQPDAYRRIRSLWLEGEHLCTAWLANRARSAPHAVISASAWRNPTTAQLAARAANVTVVADPLWPALSSLETPAPLGFVVDWPGLGTVAPGLATVVLDRLQDPGNVGTILRSAAAFGFAQVVALKGTAALWSPKVLRAGMGAHFALRLVEGSNDVALDTLAIPLLATSPRGSEALHRATLPWPCAWVLGHEGQGIDPAVARRCAQTLRIAQPGGEESLNVASAAAVCLYESARRRLDD